jgi:HEAT repeat protein
MSITYFCPNCWKAVAKSDTRCPHCQYDLSMLTEASYEDKLLLALHHCIRENRRMAVSILGELRSVRALPEFECILDTEDDFYLLRDVLTALTRIGDARSRELLQAATSHRVPMVAAAAHALLGDSGTGQAVGTDRGKLERS